MDKEQKIWFDGVDLIIKSNNGIIQGDSQEVILKGDFLISANDVKKLKYLLNSDKKHNVGYANYHINGITDFYGEYVGEIYGEYVGEIDTATLINRFTKIVSDLQREKTKVEGDVTDRDCQLINRQKEIISLKDKIKELETELETLNNIIENFNKSRRWFERTLNTRFL